MIGFGKVTTGKTPKTSRIQIIAKKVDKPSEEEVGLSNKTVVSSTFILHNPKVTGLTSRSLFNKIKSSNMNSVVEVKLQKHYPFNSC